MVASVIVSSVVSMATVVSATGEVSIPVVASKSEGAGSSVGSEGVTTATVFSVEGDASSMGPEPSS